MLRLTIAVAAATLLAACSEPTPIPTRVVVNPGLSTANAAGVTVQFTAEVIDDVGLPIPGATVTWSSGRTDVATISPTGLATVTGQGTTAIQATHATVSGSATLVVELTPAHLTKIAGDEQTASVLAQLPEDPVVRVEDLGGTPIPDVPVTFEVLSGGGSVTPLSGTTDASGQASTRWVLGETTGGQRLQASAGNLHTVFHATATEPVLIIRNQVLGHARVDVPYRHAVEIIGGEHQPLLWTIAAGQLPAGLALDTAGHIVGVPEEEGGGSFTVRVTDAAGNRAMRELSLRVCNPPLALDASEVLATFPSGLGACAPFLPSGQAGDRYRVAVLHAGTSTKPTLTPVSVSVTEIDADGRRSVAGAAHAPIAKPVALPPALAAGVRIADATARHHALLLAETERLIRRYGRDAVLRDRSTPRAVPNVALAAPEPPPERLLFRVPEIGANVCAAPGPTPVAALLVDHNDYLAVYQDSVQQAADPVAKSAVRQMLDYYEAYGVETIEEYFGGVPDINGDQRVNVFVSPVVEEGYAAFVWGADFLDRSRCAGSNEMELVYFNVNMFHSLAQAPDDGHYQALGTMVHEVKHVSSLYRRSLGGGHHPSWIEEGTAEIAGEMSSRKAMERIGGIAVGDMLRRDAYPPRDGSIITPENYAMLLRLARTSRSYTAAANSLTSDPAKRHTYYGTSWHFHRFLGDAYGNAAERADAAFFTALNDTSHSPGLNGIREATGKSVQALLEEYAVAMMLNGTDAPAPMRTFRTYDFPSATFELFRPNFQPEGLYPWPRTGPEPAGFDPATYAGNLAPAGLRFHEFESDGEGAGIELDVTVDGADARVIIVRLR